MRVKPPAAPATWSPNARPATPEPTGPTRTPGWYSYRSEPHRKPPKTSPPSAKPTEKQQCHDYRPASRIRKDDLAGRLRDHSDCTADSISTVRAKTGRRYW